jgi:hypothetical protein
MRTTPERPWQAITDPEIRATYHFGTAVVDPPRRLGR